MKISSENDFFVRVGMVFSSDRARMHFFDLWALWVVVVLLVRLGAFGSRTKAGHCFQLTQACQLWPHSGLPKACLPLPKMSFFF